MKKPTRTLILPIALAVVIFVFSSFSTESSNAQSGLVVNILAAIFPQIADLDCLVTIVRKLAHFTEYTLLGFFAARTFKAYGKNPFWSVAASSAYAVSDELHQLLVPGRSCQITDILIDSAGAAFGALIYYLASRKPKPQAKNSGAKVSGA